MVYLWDSGGASKSMEDLVGDTDYDPSSTPFLVMLHEKLAEVERLAQKEAARWHGRAAYDGRPMLPHRSVSDSDCIEPKSPGSRRPSTVWEDFLKHTREQGLNVNTFPTVPRTSQPTMTRANSKFDQVVDTLGSGSYQASAVRKQQQTFWSRLRSDKVMRLLVLDSVIGVFIILNSLAVGLSSDLLVGWFGWTVLDYVFAAVFTTELVLKLCSMGCREYLLGTDKYWNVFEAALVVLALVEIVAALTLAADESGGGADKLSLFRILRLTRITRILRVCRFEFFSELMVMVKGTIGGFKTLVWASFLLVLPLYGVSILFRETLGNNADSGMGAECFATVPEAFYTVVRCIAAGECTDHLGRPIFALVASTYGWGYAFVYCLVELLMTFGLFNVISAIFIENVLAGAKANAQLLRRHRLRDMSYFAQRMSDLMRVIVKVVHDQKVREATRNGEAVEEMPRTQEEMLQFAAGLEITPEVFCEVLQRAGVTEIFNDLALADEDTFNLFETLDADGSGTLDMTELFDGIAKLRGEARRSDVIANNVLLHKLNNELRELRNDTHSLWDRQEQCLFGVAGTSRDASKEPVLISLAGSSGNPSKEPVLVSMGRPSRSASKNGNRGGVANRAEEEPDIAALSPRSC